MLPYATLNPFDVRADGVETTIPPWTMSQSSTVVLTGLISKSLKMMSGLYGASGTI